MIMELPSFCVTGKKKVLFVFMSHLLFLFSIFVLSDLLPAFFDHATHLKRPPTKELSASTSF